MLLLKCFSATLLTMVVPVFFSACISAPPKKPNFVEQVKKENAVAFELAKDFEARLHIRSDAAVDTYLQKVGHRLETLSGDPRLANTQIAVVQDQGSQWRSYSLPGKRVYLSLGWLKKAQTDSELAALIAIELGQIQQRQVLNHLEVWESKKTASEKLPTHDSANNLASDSKDEKKKPEFFGVNGLFTYNQKEMEAAISSAVGIMYKAGFDSRGLVSNFETEKDNTEHSSLPENVLISLVEAARDSVDSYPPLINPIVRTREFASIRKRIQNL